MLNFKYDHATKHSYINNNDLYNKSKTQFNTVYRLSAQITYRSHRSELSSSIELD